MNNSQEVLYGRLAALAIDEPLTQLTFARRLARENGWSAVYAERVVDEYKRFLFLACEAGHVVSPSDQVDQAWHLHLTYTRSYWNDLCRDVLGKPLHHGPTKGGAAEQERFWDLYERTLESYRRVFGHEPPADIWPPASQRFGEDVDQVRVNKSHYWLIPKPHFKRWIASQPQAVALGLVAIPLAAAAWNPFDWKGPEFLTFYLAVVVLALIAALVVRFILTPDSEVPAPTLPQTLDPYAAACLVAGPRRAIQAAFAALVQIGNLRIVEEAGSGLFARKSTRIEQGTDLDFGAPALERALFAAVKLPCSDFKPLAEAGLPVAEGIESSLRKRGLLEPRQLPLHCLAAAGIMALPLLVGLPKIFIGLERGRPVGFLIVACLATAIAALALLLVRSRLTSSGRAIRDGLQKKHQPTVALAKSGRELAAADVSLAVALAGMGCLAAAPYVKAREMLASNTYSGGCGAGCGGGGGGGCGGGGCGGGCGGCGS